MQKDIKKIANHFGINNQLSKLMEECGELIVASSKVQIEGIEQHSRFNGLVEEMADVDLIMKQIKFLTGISDDLIEQVQKTKIGRTIRRHGIE